MAKSNSENLSALLTYPFETGTLPWPTEGAKTLIYNAAYWANASKMGNIDVVQAFYPDVVGWQENEPTADIKLDEKYQTILCALPKQKEAAYYQMAQSLNHLENEGLVVFMAANDAGGKRLEKWMKEFGLETLSISKSKCRIAWAYKKNINQEFFKQKIIEGVRQIKEIEGQNFTTQPGIFGWDKIDQGSKLLINHIPNYLYGHGADFGCGYGFLSDYLLKNNSKIKSLIAAEADHNALQCAQENLKKYDNVQFQWCDLTQKLKIKVFLDFVVMNPPFHTGKKTDSDIGQKFIENAAQSLKKNGILYMVANIHLPYEKILNNLFFQVEKLDENQGFKIYKAIK